MTTIKVSVRNKRDAGLLIRILKRMSFVENVEEIRKEKVSEDQFGKLKEYLNLNSNPRYLSHIIDPVEWQKNLRNEWQ